MYDVNFGGIEQMTKRLTIALIAVALFVVLAVMPAAAVSVNPDNFNGTVIEKGATLFIGEQGLNLTHALNAVQNTEPSFQANTRDNVPSNLTIGWWASAADLYKTSPTRTINLAGRYGGSGGAMFTVASSDFVGYTGNWYVLASNGTAPLTADAALFNVQDPTLAVGVWDFSQNGKDVTGMSVPQGEHLGIKVDTNMYAATYATRNNTIFTQTAPAALVAAPTSGIMPDGTFSAWNHNSTDIANGTVVETTYPGQLTPNVYRVTNVTIAGNDRIWKTTYGWNYTTAAGANVVVWQRYWNNSDVTSSTQIWTAKNFTEDANGVTYMGRDFNTGAFGVTGAAPVQVPTATKDGFITIKVKDESGAILSSLLIGTAGTSGVYNASSIIRQYVNTQPWYLGTSSNYWVTDALNAANQYAYPVGTYSVWAESVLNNMKDNYKNAGADYTGKTVSATGTVTLVSDTVKIEANKDSVVRSKSFSITVTGKPQTTYYVWVKGTRAMSGGYDDQPPSIAENQEKIYFDTFTSAWTAHPIGDYYYENGGGSSTGTGATIWGDVAGNTTTITGFNKTRYYALINTSATGTRTVEWVTTNWTKAQKYTIRVEQRFPVVASSGYGAGYSDAGTSVKSDEVDVKVEKGAVTIVAAGDQSYYLGEEIKLSGTNTETYKTYIFLVGPNLPTQGAVISDMDPRNAFSTKSKKGVINGDTTTFKVVDVNGDNTWSWKWGTANYALDAGTYTIYAVSQAYDKDTLENAAYGTVSIIIKKPFVSATASQSTVAKGDKIFITGTAEGNPNSVQIWIMGKNYATKSTEAVNSDASFKYEIKQETTRAMSSGQYFVVVQHPMQNKQFDIDLYALDGSTNQGYVYNKQLQAAGGTTSTKIFKLLGSGSLQGSDAAEALAQGINDANVDDTYTKLQFLVEEPTIRIDPIGDKHVGDKFTITAQTNLAVDDEILVQVYSSSFKPTQKSQSGEFSGATGTVKVTKGDSGYNKISFDVDSSTFKPDEYIVTEAGVIQTTATGTALFNVLETSAKTVAPTAVVTTAAPTQAQTAAPTAVKTAAPTATPTKSPGFGALIALIGLGAVAFVVVRRH
jgi:PGF-CTERM protein